MSLRKFLQYFGTEAASTEAVQRARWLDGFAYSRCNGLARCVVVGNGRSLYQYHASHRQTPLTAGTLFVFSNTKRALTLCSLVIYLVSQTKTWLSALELKLHIGVRYPTAWLMHHKIMTPMASRETQRRLSSAAQVDDAYRGGEPPGRKPGHRSENRIPIGAAVSLNDAGNPLYVKVTPAPGFSNEAILFWAQAKLTPGSVVLSDGPNCFAVETKAGCTHQVEVVGQRKPRGLPQVKWGNTVRGTVKTMLSDTDMAFGYTKCADRDCDAFAYRFSRRFNLADLVMRFIVDVVRNNAAPQRIIRHA